MENETGGQINASGSQTTMIEQPDRTTAADAALIAYAREHGACVYSWEFSRSRRSLWLLPDGSGLHAEEEYGPDGRVSAQPIGAAEMAEMIRRFNETMEYDGKVPFSDPFRRAP